MWQVKVLAIAQLHNACKRPFDSINFRQCDNSEWIAWKWEKKASLSTGFACTYTYKQSCAMDVYCLLFSSSQESIGPFPNHSSIYLCSYRIWKCQCSHRTTAIELSKKQKKHKWKIEIPIEFFVLWDRIEETSPSFDYFVRPNNFPSTNPM